MALDPRTRSVVLAASLLGILACRESAPLLLFLGAAWTAIGAQGRARAVLHSLLPIALVVPALFAVWAALVPAQPGGPSGLEQASVAALKMLSFVSLGAAGLGGLSADELGRQLRSWRLGQPSIAAVLGALAIWPEVRMRTGQIIEARHARGLLPRRSPLHSALSLPFILRPLVIWSLRTAVARAEAWERRGLLARIESLPRVTEPPTRAGLALALGALCWLGAVLWLRAAR